MCGISVIAGATGASPDAIRRMTDAIGHRGPDASAVLCADGCMLGHARLSIIDLGTGAQPMGDASGRYTIVFNGEIYNYRDLRRALESEGQRFSTASDTEVILAGYAQWGAAVVDRLRGMFAFVIWDSHERDLFAARDLFGEKPFYYAELRGGGIVAASELKALVASGLVEQRLDRQAVDAYLAFGYVPPAMCIYRDVATLPPAHWLRWRDGKIDVRRYWTPRLLVQPITLEDAGEQLHALLRDAVRRQMVADVPIGAFLSGGLDSASIVALMHGQRSGPVRTFSVGFGDEINELPYARIVAQRYGTEHHEIDLGAPPVGPLLTRLAEVYDEPFADSSSIPTYLISEFARRHVKVVLSGDGGDEMLGGYGWYQTLALSEHMRASRLEWVALRVMSRLVRERVPGLHRFSVAAGLAARWPEMSRRAAMNQVYLSAARRRTLWGARTGAPGFDVSALDVAAPEVEGLNRAFFFDLTTYLPGDILVKVDRASMAHGLETRAPFLDRDVAEFALSLPAAIKVDARATKIVLRRACERYWPREVRERGKHGFGAPYRRWLQRDDVRSLMARVFRPEGPLRALLPGTPPRPTVSYETWILLNFGLWLERRPAIA